MKKILVIGIIVVFILGGGAVYYFSSRESGPQDPKLLLGWWQNTNKGSTFQFSDYLEFKEKDLCVGYDLSPFPLGQVSCSKYLPYTIEGDVVMVGGNPFYKWRIKGKVLETQERGGLGPKETYKRK